MQPISSKRVLTWAAVVFALYALFFYQLTGAGILSADEPRYASIAREMARSGDWVTPRLWGAPWFEKPAFLYWATALGFRLGLDADWAPRLPVAVISALFLLAFWHRVRSELNPRVAWMATVILGTSGLWIGYSHVSVTDVPMTAFFTLAILSALPWMLGKEDAQRLPIAAAFMGLGVLAKGLVPLVLSAPLLWEGRTRWRDLLRPKVLGAFLAVAAPWYVTCTWVNGSAFLKKFFIDHHLGRFTNNDLLHEQPAWFYLPVIVAAMFPWIGAALGALRVRCVHDPLRRFLLLWILWGLLFFSASTNKLPGYVLPLLPAWALLTALWLDETRDARPVWLATGLLMSLVPAVVVVLPQALAHGLSRSDFPSPTWTWLVPVVAVFPAWWLEQRQQRLAAFLIFGVLAVGGVVFLKREAIGAIDHNVSARSLWRQIEPIRAQVCVEEPLVRHWRYGLNYYSVQPLPDCEDSPLPRRVVGNPGEPPELR